PRLLVLFIRLLHPPTATLFPYTTLFRSYRTDLLEQAGVEVPTTVAELAEAATTVKDELGVTGIALGTQAGTASATEGIESIFQSDRKSTRLNSSHVKISYAVFCLKKKNK